MNFFKEVNTLRDLYAARPETQQCYSDCLKAFTTYLQQLKNQMERNMSTKDHTSEPVGRAPARKGRDNQFTRP